jgi:serpin B
MRKLTLIHGIVICGCLFVIICSGVSIPLFAAEKADLDIVAQGNNVFALDLYTQLAKDNGNLFFSPYSISSAIAMTYAGARGETAKQIAAALHFNLASEKLHPTLSDLMGTFNAAGKSYELSTANALWGQSGYKFQPEFLEITDRYYGAGFKEVDYIDDADREQARQTINKWVEEKTLDKIKDLIKPKVLNALTRLVLTNAIYFKGKWELQFKPENTANLPFFSGTKKVPDVPMMHQTAKFKYAETKEAQILEMPYKIGRAHV